MVEAQRGNDARQNEDVVDFPHSDHELYSWTAIWRSAV